MCSVEGCDRPSRNKNGTGLCRMHYARVFRHGSTDRITSKGRRESGELRQPGDRKYHAGEGYVKLWMPNHPNADKRGNIREHKYVMSEHLGRPLFSHENVHHINGDRSDNRIENLELWSRAQPSGQRVEDKIRYAIKFLKEYGYKVTKE